MRRILSMAVACLLAVVASQAALGFSRADFERVVDFSVTLKDLAAMADGARRIPPGKIVVINGTVSDLDVINKEPDAFRVRVELMTGEWIGTDQVKSYSCYVDFSGPEFARVFPARPPRNPPPGTVLLNSRVIVVGRPLEVTRTPQGEKRVLLEGMFVRPIE